MKIDERRSVFRRRLIEADDARRLELAANKFGGAKGVPMAGGSIGVEGVGGGSMFSLSSAVQSARVGELSLRKRPEELQGEENGESNFSGFGVWSVTMVRSLTDWRGVKVVRQLVLCLPPEFLGA